MVKLNEYQEKAIRKALNSEKVFLIHGPPGTGKTTTLVELIKRLVDRGEKVIATADSNTAVDNLVERLIEKGVKVIRLGNPVRVLRSIRMHTLDYLITLEPEFQKAKEYYTEIERLKKEQEKFLKPVPRYRRGLTDEEILKRASTGTPVRGLTPKILRSMARWIKIQGKIKDLYEKAQREEKKAVEKILKRAEVVCATNSTAGSEILRDYLFDTVVIDEATQSVEPSCLIPLVKGKKLIMAGDHKQLPPTVLSTEVYEELSYTLFERLIDLYGEEIYETLRIQYRMNKKIMEFSNKVFYEGKLIAHESVANHTIADLINREKYEKLKGIDREVVNPENVVVFLDVEGKESQNRGSTSYFNEEEAKVVKRVVKLLLSVGIKPQDLGVISPYEEQVNLLSDELPLEVEVKTIDGFQGREKEVIIISFVRSNEKGEIGFLKDYRRLNVAITRARRKLICIGNSKTLSRDNLYKEFLKYIEQNGIIFNYESGIKI